jgi:hypothetical protein
MHKTFDIRGWVSLGQAEVIYGLEAERLQELIRRWGVTSVSHRGSPVNPSAPPRQVLLYSKEGLERAMEQDANYRLGGEAPIAELLEFNLPSKFDLLDKED